MLTELDRGGDYIELSLDGRLTWNPLSATWLDSYSLSYTVASLLNQRFSKGKEPFWQQAYTNLVRWIIELYRVLSGGWVTLRDGTLPRMPDHRMLDFRALWKELPCGSPGSRSVRSLAS